MYLVEVQRNKLLTYLFVYLPWEGKASWLDRFCVISYSPKWGQRPGKFMHASMHAYVKCCTFSDSYIICALSVLWPCPSTYRWPCQRRGGWRSDILTEPGSYYFRQTVQSPSNFPTFLHVKRFGNCRQLRGLGNWTLRLKAKESGFDKLL